MTQLVNEEDRPFSLMDRLKNHFRSVAAKVQEHSPESEATQNIMRFMAKQLNGRALDQKDVNALCQGFGYFRENRETKPSAPLVMQIREYLQKAKPVWFLADCADLYARAVPDDLTELKQFFFEVHDALIAQERDTVERRLYGESQDKLFAAYQDKHPLWQDPNDKTPLPVTAPEAIAHVVGLVALKNDPAFAPWCTNEIAAAMKDAAMFEDRLATEMVTLLTITGDYLKTEKCLPETREKVIANTVGTIKTLSTIAAQEEDFPRFEEDRIPHEKPLAEINHDLAHTLLKNVQNRPEDYASTVERLMGVMNPLAVAMAAPYKGQIDAEIDLDKKGKLAARENRARTIIASLAPLRARLPQGEILLVDQAHASDKNASIVFSQFNGKRFRVVDGRANATKDVAAKAYATAPTSTPEQAQCRGRLVDEAESLFPVAETLPSAMPKIMETLENPYRGLAQGNEKTPALSKTHPGLKGINPRPGLH